MKSKVLYLLILLYSLHFQVGAALSKKLTHLTATDSTVNVWIVFSDKNGTPADVKITQKAAQRRIRSGYPQATYQDLPVKQAYIEAVKKFGAKKRHVLKWANAASFSIDSRSLRSVDSLSFVLEIFPVGHHKRVYEQPLNKRKAQIQIDTSAYGQSFGQLEMIGVVQAQKYIERKMGQAPGQDVLIGVFDTGFWLNHPCFAGLLRNNAIVGDSDFVDLDGDVADPDSVRTDNSHPYHHSEEHGTNTLSLIGGYDEGAFVGAAWGAEFILARTENDGRIRDGYSIRYVELHQEEDNWAAAMEWAESLGVDIVSSSLGYRDGFTDEQGIPDTSLDYSYQDLDGNSTIIARAAKRAAAQGVLIVNAMGNAGTSHEGTLSSPADVEDVISVGMVNPDRTINNASSTGPTADGRIKPDLVAQGYNVLLPNIYGTAGGYSAEGWGTSFATPLIAGLTALVRQSHPDWSANQIRNRIYQTCTYAPKQDTVDNLYGRGIPNALWACLDTSTLFLSVIGPQGEAVDGALVFSGENLLGRTDEFGTFLTDIFSSDHILTIRHDQFNPKRVPVKANLDRLTVGLQDNHIIRAALADQTGDTVDLQTVYYLPPEGTDFLEVVGNRMVEMTLQDTGTYLLYGTAQYCSKSDTVSVSVDAFTDTLFLTLSVNEWNYLPVKVVDSLKNSPEKGKFYWKQNGSQTYYSDELNQYGNVHMRYPDYGSGSYVMFVDARGYYPSDPLVVNPDTLENDTLTIVVRRREFVSVRLTDQKHNALSGGIVSWWPEDSDICSNVAVDDNGFAKIILEEPGSYYVSGGADGYQDSDLYLVDGNTDSLQISLNPTQNYLHVFLLDSADKPISIGTLHYRDAGREHFSAVAFDSAGFVAVGRENKQTVSFYATAPGYMQSNAVSMTGDFGIDTAKIVLLPRPVSRFAVFPNVIRSKDFRRGDPFSGITIDFLAAQQGSSEKLCEIAVRRIDGAIIWRHSQPLKANQPLLDSFNRPVRWNCRTSSGDTVAPGTYIITVRYGDKTHMKKVLIAG